MRFARVMIFAVKDPASNISILRLTEVLRVFSLRVYLLLELELTDPKRGSHDRHLHGKKGIHVH